MHAAAVVCFVLAVLIGAEEIAGHTISELDWVAGGLALWAASSLPSPR